MVRQVRYRPRHMLEGDSKRARTNMNDGLLPEVRQSHVWEVLIAATLDTTSKEAFGRSARQVFKCMAVCRGWRDELSEHLYRHLTRQLRVTGARAKNFKETVGTKEYDALFKLVKRYTSIVPSDLMPTRPRLPNQVFTSVIHTAVPNNLSSEPGQPDDAPRQKDLCISTFMYPLTLWLRCAADNSQDNRDNPKVHTFIVVFMTHEEDSRPIQQTMFVDKVRPRPVEPVESVESIESNTTDTSHNLAVPEYLDLIQGESLSPKAQDECLYLLNNMNDALLPCL